MPLDTSNFKETTVDSRSAEVVILDKITEVLAKPSKWCKHALSQGDNFCLIGALNVADHGHWDHVVRNDGRTLDFSQPAAKNVLKQLNYALGQSSAQLSRVHVANFNNDAATTHADVLDLIARTRASFVTDLSPPTEQVQWWC
jgi:hypothetical protein